MVVPLIQVCIRLKVVKDWDLHPIIERSALKDISSGYGAVNVKGTSCALLPENPNDAEYKGH